MREWGRDDTCIWVIDVKLLNLSRSTERVKGEEKGMYFTAFYGRCGMSALTYGRSVEVSVCLSFGELYMDSSENTELNHLISFPGASLLISIKPARQPTETISLKSWILAGTMFVLLLGVLRGLLLQVLESFLRMVIMLMTVCCYSFLTITRKLRLPVALPVFLFRQLILLMLLILSR